MINESTKKIALVLGRGLEGCGVTRCVTEMWQWGDKNNMQIDVFVYDEFSHSRGKSHVLPHTKFKKTDLLKTVDTINQTYDSVIFHSYPSSKFEKDAVYDFYHVFVKNIKIIKVGFMHELTKANIDKIPYLIPLMNQMDTIFTFTEDSFFSKSVARLLPSKIIGKNLKKYTMMFDFEKFSELREKYTLDNKDKKIVYVSRWTTMKDPRRLLLLHPILKSIDSGLTTELRGIERSIGAKVDIFDMPNVYDNTKKEPCGPVDGVPVYGPYIHAEGLEYMARNLFVASFYRMPKDPQGYGNRMEYTQIESIAVGSIPVFDKHWGENNRTKDGRRYIDIPYSAIYSDVDDLEGTAKKLKEVSLDKKSQQKYLDVSYEIAKKEFDIRNVMPQLISDIFENSFDTCKYNSEEDIIMSITGNTEFVDLYLEYNDKKDIVVFGIKELSDNIFAVIDGKRELEVKTWKKPKKIKESKKEIVTEAVDPLDDMFIYYNKKISIKNV